MWSAKDNAWVAGIIEGEGCFSEHQQPRSPVLGMRCTVVMKDKDIIHRLHSITNIGRVTQRGDLWAWNVYRKEHVFALAFALFPWLGERRRKRVAEILEHYIETAKLRKRAVCGPTMRREIVQLHSKGLVLAVIGQKVGCSRTSVTRVLKEEGVRL